MLSNTTVKNSNLAMLKQLF